jgi:cytochrome c biogenesis protein CcdA
MSAISEEKLLQIKTRIQKKVKFYSALGAYLIVCTFLTLLDYFDKSRSGIYAIDWVYWVWLGWGIGMAFGFLGAFVVPDFEERMIEKEMEKHVEK